jgi:transposase InsO family protein
VIWFWKNRSPAFPLNRLYRAINISKQAVNKHLKVVNAEGEVRAQLVVIVQQIRKDHPTMSLRSMYYKIKPEKIGRDKFEYLCREWGFMLARERNFRITTDSSGVIRFPNLVESVTVSMPNQVWVSDITYYELNGRFYYLTFISDMFSKMIKGFSVSGSLRTLSTTLPAIKMAVKKYKSVKGLILHSDGGGQYYSSDFLSITKKYEIQNSMCKEAYQNPQAERLNGIIKNNYLNHWHPSSEVQLNRMVDRAIYLFNYEKPHKSLKYSTPFEYENKFSFAMDNLSKAKSRQRQKLATNGASSPSVAGQPVSGFDVSPAIDK